MTVYVDDARIAYGRMLMSHLISDESLDELHEFAARLGLRRSWAQGLEPGKVPHYDVSETKRSHALRLGAEPLRFLTPESVAVGRKARKLPR